MEWIEPKINWGVRYDEVGDYKGDYFCLNDYNRIKNNLSYLRELAIQLYSKFNIDEMDILLYRDYFYADIINKLEANIDTIVTKTFPFKIEQTKRYKSNEPFLLFTDLNRIENTLLYIYHHLIGQYNGSMVLAFTCGGEDIQC